MKVLDRFSDYTMGWITQKSGFCSPTGTRLISFLYRIQTSYIVHPKGAEWPELETDNTAQPEQQTDPLN